jgi:AraC-like DNA-binding protein
MYKIKLFIIYFISTTCIQADDNLNVSIRQQMKILQKDRNNTEALKNICFFYLHKADYDETIRYGEQLLSIGYDDKDYENAVLYSHIVLGQAYLMRGQRNAFSHLTEAQLIGEKAKKDSALCSIYNGLGLYASNIDLDYYSSIQYYFKGIEAAKRSGYQQLHGILLTNLSGIYYLKRDTFGLRYSLEAYQLGHERNDSYLIYSSSTNTAYMYFLRKEYDKALQYIKEAEFVMNRNDIYDQTNVYAMYGFIQMEQGFVDQAIEKFEKALSLKDKSQSTSVVFALYGYAQAMEKKNQPEQAIKLLTEALAFASASNNPIHYSDLLEEISVCFETIGDYPSALTYQRLYQINKDSVFNADKERFHNELRIKYDTERQENEIQKHKIELLQKARNEQLLIAIIIVILIILFFLYYLYRRKNHFFTAIVQQNKESIRREKNLKEQIRKLRMEQQTPDMATTNESFEKYATSSLTDEKKEELFFRLERLMEEHFYTDNLLTKEKVADKLETNRTYLSQVINEKTGQSFTQYINRFRINEAVRILSNPSNEMPLKAVSADLGFNSMTTFYKLFQSAVGMTPRQYIDKVRELNI